MSSSSSPSVQFHEIFEVALEEYRKKTGKDIKTDQLFAKLQNCNSSDAVLEVLEEHALAFEQFRKGDQNVRLMRRLKPFVEVLFRLSTKDGLKESIVSIFPPAKAIFTGIGLLLEAAKRVSADYDALVELFEHFERYLRRLQVFTIIPPALGEILVKIMVELLGVLAMTTRQINQGRFKKYAKKLFLDEHDVEEVLQRLDRLTQEELRMTATQTLEVVNGLFKDIKAVIDGGEASMNNIREALVTMQTTISDDLNNIKDNQVHEKILKWLSPPDPSTNHNKACEVHKKVTPRWFLEGYIYKEWKAKGSLLWAHGKPGSGKSILCSSIIEDIKPECATGLNSFAYYYFDFNDQKKHDRRGLLSSLLIQLCTRSHRGYDILSNMFEANANGLGQPSEVDMIRCLKKVLQLLRHGRVYIIVDAVDESPIAGLPSPREKVLELIKELVDLRHPNTRFCITSRPEVDIRAVLGPLSFRNVPLDDQEGQREDITKYIKSVVDSDAKMQRWRPGDRQRVIELLSQKAKGMFRWVYCQLDTLRRCLSPGDIERTLNGLPVTLDETYERILLGIEMEKRDHAIRLLHCLAFSRRPLLVDELAEVLATQFDKGQIPRLDKDQRSIKPDEDVQLAGSTLITAIKPDVYGKTRVVQFSHYSVMEFLTSERLRGSKNEDLSRYYISLESAHTTLAQSCIGTLLQLDNHVEDVTHDFHLAEYAAQNWFHHAQYEGVAPCIQDGMNHLFDPKKNHFIVWVSVHNIDHVPSRSRPSEPTNPPEPSPLYYATLCGVRSVVEYLVRTCQQDPNKSRGGQGTPLQVAAASGHLAIVQYLLENAADVNVQDKHNSTPLHGASENEHLDVMRLLLSHSADINALDHRGDSPLHMASRNQKLGAVELLVKEGANVDVRGKPNSTPLHEASGRGSLDVMQLLLRLGADVNALDHQGDSALHRASRCQKFDVMNLLFNGGADVNVRDISHSTPLHEASGSGNLDVMRLLLSRDADVNALDHRGDSPLHKASRNQRFSAVELLVKEDANVNVRDKSHSTPLHEASENGNLDVMRLLLSHDADINALDHRGDSPLHKASRNQRFNAMKLLLNEGVEVNVRDKSKSTPLHEASGSESLYVMQLLLSLGADVNALDHRGDSPLHKASRYQKFGAVNLLVDRGADVNIRDKSNSTPLHEASGNRNLGIAQSLLTHGAHVNVFDDWGDSPLHKLFRSVTFDIMGSLQICCVKVTQDKYDKTLIRKNVNLVPPLSRKCTRAVKARDKGRSTSMHDAPQGENYAMTQLLVAYGADVNVRGWCSKTPLDLASFEGSIDVSRLLIEHGVDGRHDVGPQTPFVIDSEAARGAARWHRRLTQLLLNYKIPGTTMAERPTYAFVATVVAAAAVVVTARAVKRFR